MLITPVRRIFFVASDSIIARSQGLAEPLRVQLIKSFACLYLYWCIVLMLLCQEVIRRDSERELFTTISHTHVLKNTEKENLLPQIIR